MIRPATETAANLRRLMAQRGLSVAETAKRSGLDQRTVRAILHGSSRTHTRSLGKLAEGLEVSADELFLPPALLVQRQLDRDTNPAVDEAVAENPGLFEGWTEADFGELYSRVGTGGGLTADGALDAARALNRRRELCDKLAVLLESSHSELIAGIIEVAYGQVTGS